MAMTRLDKLLSNLGYGSRKGVTILIKQGKVLIDGVAIKNPAAKIDPDTQEILIEEQKIDPAPPLTVMIHKPVGLICDDVAEEENVFDILPYRWRLRNPGFSCAGRLDKDSRGLVVLSEDGQLVHQMISPNVETPKIYHVQTAKPIFDEDVELFESGKMMLKNEDKPLKPVQCKRLGDQTLEMVLTEGRNRQIRRMMAASDNEVTDLFRVQIGSLRIDDLEEGALKAIQKANII